MTAALEISALDVFYGGSVQALSGVSLVVPEGGFIVLLGANGAGKSTTLKAASGILPFENGRIGGGTIRFFGQDIAGVPSHQLARRGLLHVREGRHVFQGMTVEENLAAATFALTGRKARGTKGFDDVYAWFPQLRQRATTPAGFLSGGEQQMLAIGRILRTGANLLLLDEPTEGLAPVIIEQIGRTIAKLKQDGFTIILVEQNFRFAATVADRHYVVEQGKVVDMIPNNELDANIDKLHGYLGV
jgi:branched-chain amino acid transport system ATP-binding protein